VDHIGVGGILEG